MIDHFNNWAELSFWERFWSWIFMGILLLLGVFIWLVTRRDNEDPDHPGCGPDNRRPDRHADSVVLAVWGGCSRAGSGCPWDHQAGA